MELSRYRVAGEEIISVSFQVAGRKQRLVDQWGIPVDVFEECQAVGVDRAVAKFTRIEENLVFMFSGVRIDDVRRPPKRD